MDEAYPWNLQPVDGDGLPVPRLYEVLENELEEDVEEFDTDSETETETTPSEDSSGTSVLSADLF